MEIINFVIANVESTSDALMILGRFYVTAFAQRSSFSRHSPVGQVDQKEREREGEGEKRGIIKEQIDQWWRWGRDWGLGWEFSLSCYGVR